MPSHIPLSPQVILRMESIMKQSHKTSKHLSQTRIALQSHKNLLLAVLLFPALPLTGEIQLTVLSISEPYIYTPTIILKTPPSLFTKAPYTKRTLLFDRRTTITICKQRQATHPEYPDAVFLTSSHLPFLQCYPETHHSQNRKYYQAADVLDMFLPVTSYLCPRNIPLVEPCHSECHQTKDSCNN